VSCPLSSLAPLLCGSRPAEPLRSTARTEETLRKIVGLSCSPLEKHARPAALLLNHSPERLVAVFSVRRTIPEPLTGFKRELSEVLYYTLGKAAF